MWECGIPNRELLGLNVQLLVFSPVQISLEYLHLGPDLGLLKQKSLFFCHIFSIFCFARGKGTIQDYTVQGTLDLLVYLEFLKQISIFLLQLLLMNTAVIWF